MIFGTSVEMKIMKAMFRLLRQLVLNKPIDKDGWFENEMISDVQFNFSHERGGIGKSYSGLRW